ncbi:MAG TPA: cbb3-type cytochrome oxidase assembly protein CcoS [Verrucomicrobiae bacterium]|nr:cbb3-type cytochrome oxidase assembly protein CcoS [Verrucomicrobiae bacterium]
MSAILILIAASLGMACLFLAAFIFAVRRGQFEDTSTPSLRMLADETESKRNSSISETKSKNNEHKRRNI